MASLAEERLERLARVNRLVAKDVDPVGDEPKLRELIDDPIMRRLLASDGIDRDKLVNVIGDARAKLARRPR